MGVLNIDDQTYRALNRWSWSTAKHVLDCPAEALDQRKRPIDTTDPMRLGTLMHALILERDTIDDRYVVTPEIVKGSNGYTWEGAGVMFKLKREAQAALAERLGDRQQITRDALEMLDAWCDAPRNMIQAMQAKPEIAMAGEIEGCACKGKADAISDRWLIDVKTVSDIKPANIERTAVQRRWLGQLWTYAELARQAGMEPEKIAIMLVQAPKASGTPIKMSASRQPRAAWRVMTLSEEALAYGESEARRVWRAIRDCESANDWPEYRAGVLNLPRWAKVEEVSAEVF